MDNEALLEDVEIFSLYALRDRKTCDCYRTTNFEDLVVVLVNVVIGCRYSLECAALAVIPVNIVVGCCYSPECGGLEVSLADVAAGYRNSTNFGVSWVGPEVVVTGYRDSLGNGFLEVKLEGTAADCRSNTCI